ncbi:MAG TPA: hypothetical protein ENK55_01520 [Actinobacteria bacterium]|nr:hypothetical protein [Actinomycetota bacterium]
MGAAPRPWPWDEERATRRGRRRGRTPRVAPGGAGSAGGRGWWRRRCRGPPRRGGRRRRWRGPWGDRTRRHLRVQGGRQPPM